MRKVRGSVSVELALALPVFLGMLLIMFESARALYLLNTLAEASRRAARAVATTDFNLAPSLDQIRERALFGKPVLPLGAPISTAHIQISYLAADRATPVSPVPACPEANLAACTANPNASNCVRFVRVRICQPGGGASCDPVPFEPLLGAGGLIPAVSLPRFETIAPVESLGHQSGAASSCS